MQYLYQAQTYLLYPLSVFRSAGGFIHGFRYTSRAFVRMQAAVRRGGATSPRGARKSVEGGMRRVCALLGWHQVQCSCVLTSY